jgi:signal transduction histidine kinase
MVGAQPAGVIWSTPPKFPPICYGFGLWWVGYGPQRATGSEMNGSSGTGQIPGVGTTVAGEAAPRTSELGAREVGNAQSGSLLRMPSAPRVLVVEDQPAVRLVMASVLRACGYETVVAESLAEARPLVEGTSVVLLDINLPDGEGLELLPVVRALEHPPSVVISTGFGTIDNVVQAMNDGAFGFLIKPVRPQALQTMVRRAVDHWAEQRDLALHRLILRSVQDVVVAVDADGGVAYFNTGAERALGWLGDESVGVEVGRFVECPASDGSGDYEGYLRDGGRGVLQGTWSTIASNGARLLVGRDVTRERRIQRDMMRQGALAELGLMLAEAAHEINNPATFLLANLTTIREDLEAGEFDQGSALEMILECLEGVRRIADIVKRLRDLTRTQTNERPERIDLGRAVRDAVHIAAVRVGRRAGIHVQIVEPVFVMAMQGRLAQAVMNLVVNAADALEGQTSPTPRIDLVVSEGEVDGVRMGIVEVTDNGPGVPPSMRDSLFEPFMTSKPGSEGGTGLGLPISKTFVEEVGGRLELMDRGGGGACFRIRLPLASRS